MKNENMIEFEYEVSGDLDLNKLWSMYSNVENWKLWDEELERVKLDGDFTENTNGMMYFKNMPPVGIKLFDVTENKEFSTISELSDIAIRIVFIHKISETKIFHKVSISSLADTDLSNFKEFEGDLIKSVDKLYEICKK